MAGLTPLGSGSALALSWLGSARFGSAPPSSARLKHMFDAAYSKYKHHRDHKYDCREAAHLGGVHWSRVGWSGRGGRESRLWSFLVVHCGSPWVGHCSEKGELFPPPPRGPTGASGIHPYIYGIIYLMVVEFCKQNGRFNDGAADLLFEAQSSLWVG